MATANWKECEDKQPDRHSSYLAEIHGQDNIVMAFYGQPESFKNVGWFIHSEHTDHFEPVNVIRWDYPPSRKR